MKKILIGTIFSLVSCLVYSQQRVIEDSLVYNDPTVAKQSKWVKGVSIDYNYTQKDGVGYDSQGGAHYQATNSSTVGFSAFGGYGNFTLMATYAPEKYSTTVPPSGNLSSTTNINGSTDWYEVIGRYLITDLQTKYFVPYVLGGFAYVKDRQDMDVYVNGVREVNKTKSSGPGIGLGAIIPLTKNYGLRADIREYFASVTTSSNVIGAFNRTREVQYIRSTVTGYYNISDNVNLQLGLQSSFIVNQVKSTGTGGYLKLGYTF